MSAGQLCSGRDALVMVCQHFVELTHYSFQKGSTPDSKEKTGPFTDVSLVVLDPATGAPAAWLNGCDAADVVAPEFPHHFYIYNGKETFVGMEPGDYWWFIQNPPD